MNQVRELRTLDLNITSQNMTPSILKSKHWPFACIYCLYSMFMRKSRSFWCKKWLESIEIMGSCFTFTICRHIIWGSIGITCTCTMYTLVPVVGCNGNIAMFYHVHDVILLLKDIAFGFLLVNMVWIWYNFLSNRCLFSAFGRTTDAQFTCNFQVNFALISSCNKWVALH